MSNLADNSKGYRPLSDASEFIAEHRAPERIDLLQQPINGFDGSRVVSLSDPLRPSLLRLPISYRGIPAFAAFLDLSIIVLSALASGAVYHLTVSSMEGELSRTMAAAVFVAVLFISATRLRQLYEPSRLLAWNEQLQNVLGAWCGTFFLLASGVFTSGVGKDLSRGTILLFWALGGLTLCAHRALWRIYLPNALAGGALKGHNAIVLTWDDPVTTALGDLLSRHGYVISARFVLGTDIERSMTAVKSAVKLAESSRVDDVFLVPKSRHKLDVASVVSLLRILPIPVTMVPDQATAELMRYPQYELGTSLAVEIQRPPLSVVELAAKRAFDLVAAVIGVALLLPVSVAVAIAINLDSAGPILFRQTRHGFNGRPFRIFKFRTMHVLEDGDVIKQATRNDKRVTRVGAWLRRTSVDELPQLLNVLRGEMSIVGPRPHSAAHERIFSESVGAYALRHQVKSGITGWAQINGARGETDTLEKIEKRVDFDLWYINHWSPWLDLLIVVRTIGVVLWSGNAV